MSKAIGIGLGSIVLAIILLFQWVAILNEGLFILPPEKQYCNIYC
jgi:hypothetical protein